MVNTGGRQGGAITAALFLKQVKSMLHLVVKNVTHGNILSYLDVFHSMPLILYSFCFTRFMSLFYYAFHSSLLQFLLLV